jgi:hypothetical protein
MPSLGANILKEGLNCASATAVLAGHVRVDVQICLDQFCRTEIWVRSLIWEIDVPISVAEAWKRAK